MMSNLKLHKMIKIETKQNGNDHERFWNYKTKYYKRARTNQRTKQRNLHQELW